MFNAGKNGTGFKVYGYSINFLGIPKSVSPTCTLHDSDNSTMRSSLILTVASIVFDKDFFEQLCEIASNATSVAATAKRTKKDIFFEENDGR
ncbi:hypothetical protein [Mucilaginibacter limnophilus]|uniref:hypothetical protein n=1 Tax=Mucilaginibacter limnophilus TaxID=1932778 RepID=UPI000FDAB2B6|nr:hypothetical protein [Mucilaginibacter limnophilus]